MKLLLFVVNKVVDEVVMLFVVVVDLVLAPPPSLHFCTPIPLVSVGQIRLRG
jgi:hypothetical protein